MSQARTRIVETGLDLFLRDGFDHVTIADIARAAKVSPRTVHRYFPAKEDIVLEPDEFRALVAALRATPPDLAPLDAVATVLRATAPDPSTAPLEARRVELITTTPTLERAWAGSLDSLGDDLRAWLSERVGLPADDLAVRVTVASMLAVHRLLVVTWSRSSLDDYLVEAERALAMLGEGLAPHLRPAPT